MRAPKLGESRLRFPILEYERPIIFLETSGVGGFSVRLHFYCVTEWRTETIGDGLNYERARDTIRTAYECLSLSPQSRFCKQADPAVCRNRDGGYDHYEFERDAGFDDCVGGLRFHSSRNADRCVERIEGHSERTGRRG